MKLVRVRRTGTPCFAFDNTLDRGFDVATGDEVSVTEMASVELLRVGGWELVDAPSPAPKSKKEK